jgi:hypothetical protein
MTKLEEMIEVIRAENPDGLRVGDDEHGYTDLSEADYEATIVNWATARLEKQAKLAEQKEIIEAKKEAIVKLVELGINPKAFGL